MHDALAVRAGTSSAAHGKEGRLVAAACGVVYRQGVHGATPADIANAADVPLGNVYHYFKTKDDIVAAVVQTHVDQLALAIADLECRHRTPKARLTALVELAKRGDASSAALAGQLMETLVGWAQKQFTALGRRDARDRAIELVAAYQGAAVVGSALGQPETLARRARSLTNWIDALDVRTDRAPRHGGHGRKGVIP